MNSIDNTYALPANDMILRHFPNRTLAVRDGAFFRIPRLDAAVRSGDYFTTLGTTLETIRMDIEDDNPAVAQALDNLVFDLEYLQRRYGIIKKSDVPHKKPRPLSGD